MNTPIYVHKYIIIFAPACIHKQANMHMYMHTHISIQEYTALIFFANLYSYCLKNKQ